MTAPALRLRDDVMLLRWSVAWLAGCILLGVLHVSCAQAQSPRTAPRPVQASGFDLQALRLPINEIFFGGVKKDGIPALVDPPMIPAADIADLSDGERVIGVAGAKEARAYPIKIVIWHEVVNDRLEGTPIAVTYCPLCDSVAAFDRRDGERTREFGVSGLLYNSNVLMYDRKESPEGLWSQLQARAVSGPNAGKSLQNIPVELTTWGDWKRRYPQSVVLATPGADPRDARRDPYRAYFASKELMFPVKPTSGLLPLKHRVLGVWTQFGARAYPLSMLVNLKEPLPQQLGNLRFSIAYDSKAGSARVVDADEGVFTAYSFWFAWYAFHPQTEIFIPRGRKLPASSVGAVRSPIVKLRPGNAPLADVDSGGNPLGDQFGLAQDGEFPGRRILMWSQDPDVWKYLFLDDNPLFKTLAAKGFRVHRVVEDFTPQMLQGVDQLWIFSNTKSSLEADDLDAIRRFADDGGGLYLLSDNEPHTAEANALCELLFQTRLAGDYFGQRVVEIRHDPVAESSPERKADETSGGDSQDTAAPLHPVLTGLNFVFEGDTISHLEPAEGLVPILYSSQGELLLAAAAGHERRILVDGGWTRYIRRYANSAGTMRLAENAAAYLSRPAKKGL